MPESAFTIRVDSSLKAAFVEAARVNGRTGEELIRDFRRKYVQKGRERGEYEKWFTAQVQAGLKDIQEGKVLSFVEVDERARKRRERLIVASAQEEK